MKASQGKGRKGLGMDKFADWEVGKDYECVKVLGQGSYGAVASAVHKPSGKKVAIKKMAGVFEDDVDCKRILREIYLLKQLKHAFVVELFDVIELLSLLRLFPLLQKVLQLAVPEGALLR